MFLWLYPVVISLYEFFATDHVMTENISTVIEYQIEKTLVFEIKPLIQSPNSLFLVHSVLVKVIESLLFRCV